VVERLKFNDKINNETKATVTPTTVIIVVVVMVVVVMLVQSYTCLPLSYEVLGIVFKVL
jgi:signal transduction histidine kinase